MQMELKVNYSKQSAYFFEKGQYIESFCKPLMSGREVYFSIQKQSYPDFEEKIRTQAIVVIEPT